MTSVFKAWIGGLVLTALLAAVAVAWIDKPVAPLVHGLFEQQSFANEAAHSPGLSIPFISGAVFAVFGLAALLGRKFSRLESNILLCNISLLAVEPIKNLLKFVYGRTWPDSWAPGILSLIHDNEFGFHFFHGGKSYESFPSGHAATAAAVMSVLWIAYPKLRIAWAFFIVAADVGLVLLNLHFVSDVVVGTFVGASTGLFTAALCTPKTWLGSRLQGTQQ